MSDVTESFILQKTNFILTKTGFVGIAFQNEVIFGCFESEITIKNFELIRSNFKSDGFKITIH